MRGFLRRSLPIYATVICTVVGTLILDGFIQQMVHISGHYIIFSCMFNSRCPNLTLFSVPWIHKGAGLDHYTKL